LAYHFLL